MNLKRRNFLAQLLCVLFYSKDSYSSRKARDFYQTDDKNDIFCDCFHEKELKNIVLLGEAYLKECPCELRTILVKFNPMLEKNRKHDIYYHTAISDIGNEIKIDNEEERIVCINGWWMRRTEARLCAAIYTQNTIQRNRPLI